MEKLSKICAQLKPHIAHLFGDGEERLKKLIIDKGVLFENGHARYVNIERVTFSRQFVAVDFRYKDEQQPTIYLSIREVEKYCY